jgi:hypothetical protein
LEEKGEIEMALQIITNRQPRDVLHWWELSATEQAEFEYIDTENKQSEADFVRYRGEVYDLKEFERAPKGPASSPEGADLSAWDGIRSDTYFSGVLIRYCQDYERVIVGRYYN